MDDDTRQAFASMMATMQGIDANVRASVALQTENAREFRAGLANVNTRLDGLTTDVVGLKKHVFGSEPPPPNTPTVSIVRQVSEQDMETDALKAHVIVLDGKVDKLTTMQEEQNKTLKQIADAVAVIAKAVGGFFGNPMVRRVAWVAGAAILAYLNRGQVGHLVGLQ